MMTIVLRRAGRRAGGVDDALASVPGVVVQATALGGPRAVGIRRSAADAVLGLLDGAVLNDPVTGEVTTHVTGYGDFPGSLAIDPVGGCPFAIAFTSIAVPTP